MIDTARTDLCRLLLRGAALGAVAASLVACSAPVPLEVPQPSWSAHRTTLNGQPVVAQYFTDYRRVRQSRPDRCWAAALEQALAHQRVDTDQERIAAEVYSTADKNSDQTLNMFWWQQKLSISEAQLNNGSKVWFRTDVDGWSSGAPVLSIRTFVLKIARELNAARITLVGESTGGSRGHIVTVIGFVKPADVTKITSPVDQLVGFVVYDPLVGEAQVVSTDELFKSYAALVYVVTFDSAQAAVMGHLSSTKNVW